VKGNTKDEIVPHDLAKNPSSWGDVLPRYRTVDGTTRLQIAEHQEFQHNFFKNLDLQLKAQQRLGVMQRTDKKLGGELEAKKKTLGKLEERIKRMQEAMRAETSMASTHETAAVKIQKELEDAVEIECEGCGLMLVRGTEAAHSLVCSKEKLPEDAQGHIADDSSSTSVLSRPSSRHVEAVASHRPHAPMDFKVGKVTSSTIEFHWEAPAFQGTSPVVDYQLQWHELLPSSSASASRNASDVVPEEDEDDESKGGSSLEAVSTVVRTSRWCCVPPVRSFGYLLKWLKADTTYFDFTVRAMSQSGLSAPSNKISKIKTLPLEPPSEPLWLAVTEEPTSTQFKIRWGPPMYNNGSERIAKYRIRVMVPKFADPKVDDGTPHDVRVEQLQHGHNKQQKKDGKSGMKHSRLHNILEQEKMFEFDVEELQKEGEYFLYTFRKLKGGKLYHNVNVAAVNNEGLEGPPSEPIPTVRTKDPPRRQYLEEELQRAMQQDPSIPFFDSDFRNANAVQRYRRVRAMKMILRELARIDQAEEASQKEGKEGESVTTAESAKKRLLQLGRVERSKSLVDRERNIMRQNTEPEEVEEEETVVTLRDMLLDRPLAMDQQAKTVFGEEPDLTELTLADRHQLGIIRVLLTHREVIKQLTADTEELQSIKERLKAREISLIQSVKHAERKVRILDKELDRVLEFHSKGGDHVDSSSLQGMKQRFRTEDLIRALEDKIDEFSLFIARAKREMIQLNAADKKASRSKLVKHRALCKRIVAYYRLLKQTESEENIRAEMTSEERDASLARAFEGWLFIHHGMRGFRLGEQKIDDIIRLGRLGRWWYRWNMKMSFPDAISRGDVVLKRVEKSRNALEEEATELLRQLNSSQLELTGEAKVRSSSKRGSLAAKPAWRKSLNAKDRESNEYVEKRMHEVDRMYRHRKFEDALALCQELSNKANITHANRSLLWGRMGQCWVQLGHYATAWHCYERGLEWSQGPTVARAMALEGWAEVLVYFNETKRVISALEECINIYEKLGLLDKSAAACRTLAERMRIKGLNHESHRLEERAIDIETRMENKIQRGLKTLDKIRNRLIGEATAEACQALELEKVTYGVPRMRRERLALLEKLWEAKDALEVAEEDAGEKHRILTQAKEDLDLAVAAEAEVVRSSAFGGREKVYQLEDFKEKLGSELANMTAADQEAAEEVQNYKLRVVNVEDEIKQMEGDLEIETGDLMKRILAKKPVSCLSLNYANQQLNDSTGRVSGGVTLMALCQGRHCFIYDILCGVCLDTLSGDSEDNHPGEPEGHIQSISAVFFYHMRVYTGGLDHAIHCWDIDIQNGSKMLKRLSAQEATITSITADEEKLVTGGADCSIYVWDVNQGFTLRSVLRGHQKAITSLLISSQEVFASGDGEGQCRIWQVLHSKKKDFTPLSQIDCVLTLSHARERDKNDPRRVITYSVSCMQFKGIELIYGSDKGKIFQWDLEKSKCMRQIKSHECKIMDISFDAVRIVAGGADGRIRIFDVMTGHAMQTLETDAGACLGLQFDSHFVFSAHRAGLLQRFAWASSADESSALTYHIFGPGDSVKKLSKKYGTPFKDLMNWNDLKDVRDAYLGMQLVVKKGYHIEEEETSKLYGKLTFEKKIKLRYLKKREKRKASLLLKQQSQQAAVIQSQMQDLQKLEAQKKLEEQKAQETKENESSDDYVTDEDQESNSDAHDSDSGTSDNEKGDVR